MGAIPGYDIPHDEPEPQVCPGCGGTGHGKYMAFNIRTRKEVEVTRQAWICLPPGEDEAFEAGQNYCQMELEKCSECDGTGEVYDI